jgi:hypothetical protein
VGGAYEPVVDVEDALNTEDFWVWGKVQREAMRCLAVRRNLGAKTINRVSERSWRQVDEWIRNNTGRERTR